MTLRALARIAADVDGVVDVTNDLRTALLSRRDEDLQYQIAGRIYTAPEFCDLSAGRSVHIIVENGRVLLTGTVSSHAARQVAESMTSSVPGVVSVDNKLTCESEE